MSIIKHKYIRFYAIDEMLKNSMHTFPTKEELRAKCEECVFGTFLEENTCISTIEKDLAELRADFDAPIEYDKQNRGYYYSERFVLDVTPSMIFKRMIESILFICEDYPENDLSSRIKRVMGKI